MATNRFIQRQNITEQPYNENKMLLNIMKQEFPNDPYYKNNTLTPTTLTGTIEPIIAANDSVVQIAKRNGSNVINVYKDVTEYTEYTIDKSIPTISEESLDDLLFS